MENLKTFEEFDWTFGLGKNKSKPVNKGHEKGKIFNSDGGEYHDTVFDEYPDQSIYDGITNDIINNFDPSKLKIIEEIEGHDENEYNFSYKLDGDIIKTDNCHIIINGIELKARYGTCRLIKFFNDHLKKLEQRRKDDKLNKYRQKYNPRPE